MTTGPLPRMRTEAGFGPGGLTGRSIRGRGDEPVEHGQGIERSGRALGVVLDGLDGQLGVAQALDRPVVEVELADPEPGRRRQRLADDLDLVVLGGHLDESELHVLDRVVGPVMAEPQPAGVGAGGPADDLVPEADPQQRPPVVDDRAGQGDLGLEPRRVARARATGSARRCRETGRPPPRPCAGRPGRGRRGGASPGRCST